MSGIIRVNKEKDRYARISNDLLNDKRLSWEARGLMGYLLSKPDNWTIRTHDLIKQGPAGRDKVTRILKELEQAGYIQRVCYQLKNGQFEWETVVYETPTASGKTVTGKTVNGKSADGSAVDGKPPHIVTTDLPTTEEITTETITTKSAPEAVVIILLSKLGIVGKPVKELANLQHVNEGYLNRWIEYQEENSVHPGVIVNAIRAGQDAPGKKRMVFSAKGEGGYTGSRLTPEQWQIYESLQRGEQPRVVGNNDEGFSL